MSKGAGSGNDSINDLLRGFQYKRTKDEFEKVVVALLPRLLRHLYRIVGNLQRAEDITQEVLLIVWSKLPQPQRDDTPLAWVFAVARNAAINHFRKSDPELSNTISAGRGEEETGAAAAIVPTDKNPGPAETVANREESSEALARMRTHLDSLTSEERDCWVIKHLDDLTVEEIANQTGLARHQVRELITKAQRKLDFQEGMFFARSCLTQSERIVAFRCEINDEGIADIALDPRLSTENVGALQKSALSRIEAAVAMIYLARAELLRQDTLEFVRLGLILRFNELQLEESLELPAAEVAANRERLARLVHARILFDRHRYDRKAFASWIRDFLEAAVLGRSAGQLIPYDAMPPAKAPADWREHLREVWATPTLVSEVWGRPNLFAGDRTGLDI